MYTTIYRFKEHLWHHLPKFITKWRKIGKFWFHHPCSPTKFAHSPKKNSFEHSMRNLFNLKFERFMGPLPYTTLIYGSLVYLPIWSYAILYLIFNQKCQTGCLDIIKHSQLYLILSCDISSLLDRELVRWSTVSCALAWACRPSVSKKFNKIKLKTLLDNDLHQW